MSNTETLPEKPQKKRKLKGYIGRFSQSFTALKALEKLGCISAFRMASHDRRPAELSRAFKIAGVRKIDLRYISEALQLATHWLEHGEYNPALMTKLRPTVLQERKKAERVMRALKKIDGPKKGNPPEIVFSASWKKMSPLSLTLCFLSQSATQKDREFLSKFIHAQLKNGGQYPQTHSPLKKQRRVSRRSWGVKY